MATGIKRVLYIERKQRVQKANARDGVGGQAGSGHCQYKEAETG